MNKVFIFGHVGSQPEVKHTPNGNTVANFSIATTKRWTSKSGERQEKTEWHRIVAWNRQAELVGEYVGKGKQLLVEGTLQTRKYTDRDNNERYTTEILAERIEFGGGTSTTGGGDEGYHEELGDSSEG